MRIFLPPFSPDSYGNGVALDRHFGVAGAPAALMLVQVQVWALDRRFALRVAC